MVKNGQNGDVLSSCKNTLKEEKELHDLRQLYNFSTGGSTERVVDLSPIKFNGCQKYLMLQCTVTCYVALRLLVFLSKPQLCRSLHFKHICAGSGWACAGSAHFGHGTVS